jgi:beta-lactamase class A
MEPTRRGGLGLLFAGAAASLSACAGRVAPQEQAPWTATFSEKIAALESAAGGRLGVFLRDTGSGASAGHRADERFAMCSTFKLFLAAQVLARIEQGLDKAETELAFTAADLVPHAPTVEENLARGRLSLMELAWTVQVTSDNAAANLLIRHLGGPEAFTAAMRAAGDAVTRLDRYEVEMSVVPADDPRDRTSPAASAASMAHFVLGQGLNAEHKALLWRWMVETETGLARLRAGLPASWRAGDKTGTGRHRTMDNQHNDMAIFYPGPNAAPWLLTAFYQAPGHFSTQRDQDNAVLAEVGKLAAAAVRSAQA